MLCYTTKPYVWSIKPLPEPMLNYCLWDFTKLTSDAIEVIFFEGNAVDNGWGLSVDSEFIHDNGTRVEKNSHSYIG